MLLVLHNLPTYMNYAEIKQLIQSKSGLSQVILDNLVSEGLTKKVTVGLADSADAAIFARKINGLYIGGQQLYVEDVRIQKESEQPYRSSKAASYSSMDAFGRQDASSSMMAELPSVPMSNPNPMSNAMAMMNYNMAMGTYYIPAPVPMPQHMAGFNQAQAPVMSDIAQMYDQSRQAENFDRKLNEGNHRSRNNREPKGRASNRHPSPQRRGPENIDNRNRRAEFPDNRARGSEMNFDNSQMWNQHNAAIQALTKQPTRSPIWTDNTEQRQLIDVGGRQNHSEQYGNFNNMLPAANFALDNRQNSSFQNKRDDFRQPSKRVRGIWDEEPQPKRLATSGVLERPPRNSNWKESAFVETNAYPSNTNMSVPNTWNKSFSNDSGFSSTPQSRDEQPVNVQKQTNKSNTWRGQATSAIAKEIANKFRIDIKPTTTTDISMLVHLKNVIRTRINKMLKNDIYTTGEKIQEMFRAKHAEVDIYREALDAASCWKLQNNNEEKPKPKIEGMTGMMLPPKAYPNASANAASTSGMSSNTKPRFDKTTSNAWPQKNFDKKPFANAPPQKNFDKKPFANAPPQKNFTKKAFANAPPQKNFDKKPFAKASPQKNFDKKPFGNAPPQKKFDKKFNKNMEARSNLKNLIDQETGLPKYPNSDKKTLAMIKDLEKRELSGEQVYELSSELQKIVEGHCDTLCDLFMGECLNPEGEEEMNVCEEINNVAADEFRKVIRLQLIKRILNITNGLVIQIYFSFKPPRKPFLEAFLQKYDVICLKKATGDKKYVASFGSFKGYDALNSLKNAVVENVNLNFRPRIATGQKAKRGAGRPAVVKVQSLKVQKPGESDGTSDGTAVENDNSEENTVDNVKEENAAVKTEEDANTTDVKNDDAVVDNDTDNENFNASAETVNISEQSQSTQEANCETEEQFTEDVNEEECNVDFNEECGNDEMEGNNGEELNDGKEFNDGEGFNDGGEFNVGVNDGGEFNDGEELNDGGEFNDGEELDEGEECNDDGNADDINEVENVDENDLEDW